MRTRRLRAENDRDVREAAAILRAGGLVAFPTETVYGLGANALDAAAVRRIFEAKQRPAWDPLIVHVSAADEVARVAVVEAVRARLHLLAAAFWPGPLTMLLPRSAGVPDVVTARRARVGVRVPRHPVALQLIDLSGVPVAAPSANRFGHTSPTTAGHVLHDLDGRIDAVLDGGPTMVGVESTVLDLCETPLRVYRPGAVTAEAIAAAIHEPVESYLQAGPSADLQRAGLPSPGVALRHYAPRARLVLVADQGAMREAIRDGGDAVGVMLPAGWLAAEARYVYAWGDWRDMEVLARRVFAGLRELDAQGAEVIVCPMPPAEGLGAALRDRLSKAAMRE